MYVYMFIFIYIYRCMKSPGLAHMSEFTYMFLKRGHGRGRPSLMRTAVEPDEPMVTYKDDRGNLRKPQLPEQLHRKRKIS